MNQKTFFFIVIVALVGTQSVDCIFDRFLQVFSRNKDANVEKGTDSTVDLADSRDDSQGIKIATGGSQAKPDNGSPNIFAINSINNKNSAQQTGGRNLFSRLFKSRQISPAPYAAPQSVNVYVPSPQSENVKNNDNKQNVEPKVEPKIEPKADQKVEPKIEPKADQKVEPKIEPKADQKVEPKIEPKADQKVEPNKPEAKPIVSEPSADNKVPSSENATEDKLVNAQPSEQKLEVTDDSKANHETNINKNEQAGNNEEIGSHKEQIESSENVGNDDKSKEATPNDNDDANNLEILEADKEDNQIEDKNNDSQVDGASASDEDNKAEAGKTDDKQGDEESSADEGKSESGVLEDQPKAEPVEAGPEDDAAKDLEGETNDIEESSKAPADNKDGSNGDSKNQQPTYSTVVQQINDPTGSDNAKQGINISK